MYGRPGFYLSDGRVSRHGRVLVGSLTTWFSSLVGLLAFLRWGPTLPALLAVPVACLACQALAVAAVVRPGPEVRSRQLVEHYQGWTVSLVCGSWIVGVLPAVVVLSGRPARAVLLAGAALMAASMAGLITVAVRSDHAVSGSGAKRLPGDPDGADIDVGVLGHEGDA
jgi:hypothetical protein